MSGKQPRSGGKDFVKQAQSTNTSKPTGSAVKAHASMSAKQGATPSHFKPVQSNQGGTSQNVYGEAIKRVLIPKIKK